MKTFELTKSFGGLTAVNKVDFRVPSGTIVGLIGPNGSGKTTLLNLIAGTLLPTSGRVLFQGLDITRRSAHECAHLGIARTFQIPRPLQEMTVAENIRLARWFGIGKKHADPGNDVELDVQNICEFVGLGGKYDSYAGDLNVVSRKKLELARALGMKTQDIAPG